MVENVPLEDLFKAAEPAPSPSSFPVTVTPPPGQHRQTPSSEARVVMQSIGVSFSYGKATDPGISPNMSSMMSYANLVLQNSALPALTKVYAPNENASLLHDLQVRLGV